LVRQIDLSLLGPQHLWKGKVIPFDPEGLLSTLPATVTVLLGWWAGQMMQTKNDDKQATLRSLLRWGVTLSAAGLLWNMGFPMNKSLWTSSFVLFTGGISMLVLAFSVWAIDIKGWRRGTQFFLVFGANPLFAYILSGLIVKSLLNIKWTVEAENWTGYKWVYQTVFAPIEPYKTGSFLFALVFLLICWGVCWVLYRRKVFFKV
jgi:predicted acyltransferase